MAKRTKGGFYAVKKGRATGIWTDWATCEMQIKGFPGATYQKFDTKQEAEEYLTSQPSPAVTTVQLDDAAPAATTSYLPKGGAYYAVRIGHKPGIYHDWPSAKMQTDNYPGARYKKFTTRGEAVDYLKEIPWLDPLSTNGTDSAETPKGKKRAISEDESGYDVVYTDGACRGNGKFGALAGVGVWWGHDDSRNIAERCPGAQTNQRAELTAIMRVLEETPTTKKGIEIKTDSKYSIDCLDNWLNGWRRNGYRNSKGEPVVNLDIILYADALRQKRKISGQSVKLTYVKGHAGIEGNEGADRQAVFGATLSEMPNRDWAALEAKVLQEIKEIKAAASAVVQPPVTQPSPAPSPSRNPTKVRKLTVEPSTLASTPPPQLATEPIDLDAVPEPPQSPRHAGRSKKLPSAAERQAEIRRRALLIYPLLPEEMEQAQVKAVEEEFIDLTPRASPSPLKAAASNGARGISTKASASQAAKRHQPRPQPVASSSRVQLPSAPEGNVPKPDLDQNELVDYAKGLVDDDDMLEDL